MSLSPGRVRHRDPNRRGGSPLWAYLALMSAPGNLPRALRCFKLRVRPASRAARRGNGTRSPQWCVRVSLAIDTRSPTAR